MMAFYVDFGVTYLCKEFLRLNEYVANSLGFLRIDHELYTEPCLDVPQRKSRRRPGPVLAFPGHRGDRAGHQQRHEIYLLHNRFRLNFYLAKLFATGVVTFWNFFMNYFFTF